MRKTNTNQPFSKKRRLAEAAALETSLDDSFMNNRPASLKKKRKTTKKKTAKKIVKKTTLQCHVRGSATSQPRARCYCGKFIHKDCKTYGVCFN